MSDLGLRPGSGQIIMESPTLEEASSAVKNGISRHRTVILAGNCWVDYEGRASSKLDPGERVALIKPDGSVLIHRPKDYPPVNWQPPGSLFRTRLRKDGLHVRAYRRKEREVLDVTFNEISLVAVLDLKDVGEFYLYASEKDMQDAILVEPSLLEEGFKPISSERPVDPGFIDIIGIDKDNVLTIVEIKRKPATKDAVLQLQKYMDVYASDSSRRVRGILVAPELARGSQKMLASLGLEFKSLSPQRCAEVLKRRRERSLTDFFK